MGLFDKLKDILFEEETIEIPVIKKEEIKKEVEPKSKKETKKVQDKSDTDEIKITKITSTDDTFFDMPKLKNTSKERKEEPEEKQTASKSAFSFPVFEDDDLDFSSLKRTSEKPKTEEKTVVHSYEPKSRNSLLFDDEEFKEIEPKKHMSKPKKEEHKAYNASSFKLSPIISPVYGVLDEDYKKEDIVSRNERRILSTEKLDLDSVRKKAYGTLEDEIEETLTKEEPEEKRVEEKKVEVDALPEDGLSVKDLLTDETEDFVVDIDEVSEKVNEEIELDELDELKEEKKEPEKKVVKEEPKKDEDPLEDDLFDLIDSLYVGKGEN